MWQNSLIERTLNEPYEILPTLERIPCLSWSSQVLDTFRGLELIRDPKLKLGLYQQESETDTDNRNF